MSFQSISTESRQYLKEEFTAEEILEGLNSCDDNKALDPDGFSMNFLQCFWPLLKEDILAVFENLHSKGKFIKSLNTTFITLIPKKSGANEFKDFRPISLIGCIYKFVATVLVRRLVKVIGEIIGDCQHAFVGGRQILDVVMSANETVDDLLINKKDGLVCKLDMEKEYDHVNWNFVDYMLLRMEFGQKWRKRMKVCVTTTSFTILVNGGLSNFFNVSRGLQQSDPLSPILSIIVMEALNKLLNRAHE